MSDTTMVDVMDEHHIDFARSDVDNTGHCICGGWVDGMGYSWDEHLADALKEAGFGLLSEAWDEGHETGKHYPWGKRGFLTDDNPYRNSATSEAKTTILRLDAPNAKWEEL